MRVYMSVPLMMIAMIASLSHMALADSHDKGDKGAAKTMLGTNQVVGTKILDASNEQMGVVRDLIIDRDGKVMYLITGIGGYAGVLEERVAIPAQAVTCKCEMKDDVQSCHVSLPMTREVLGESPKLESKNNAELIDSNWVTRNNTHFAIKEAGAVPKAGEIFLFSELNGKTVHCSNNHEFGTVSDLVMSPEDRKIGYVVIGHGGTLGVGKSLIAVPFSALKVARDSDEWKVSVNQPHEVLNELPKVTSPEYRELKNEGNRDSIKAVFKSAKELKPEADLKPEVDVRPGADLNR